MGTRHLIKVTYGDELRVAQYGQFDGYFTGRGLEVAAFVTRLMDRDVLEDFRNATLLCDLRYGDDSPLPDDTDIEDEPQFSRGTSVEVLDLILSHYHKTGDLREPFDLYDASEFENDSLFCEYVYHLDLDRRAVIVTWGWDQSESNPRQTKMYSFPDYVEMIHEHLAKPDVELGD